MLEKKRMLTKREDTFDGPISKMEIREKNQSSLRFITGNSDS